jgi:cell volume regulation protein A
MYFDASNILLIGSILLFVSIIVGKTGYRFGVPTLLLFLLVGMFFGSDGLGIQFHNVEEAQFIGMLVLSIILFSGGMDTKIADIRPVLAAGISLNFFRRQINRRCFSFVYYSIFGRCNFRLFVRKIGCIDFESIEY